MFRVGDSVTPFNHMSRVGIVHEIRMEKPKSWFVGGTASETMMVVVKFPDDDNQYLYRSSDLRKAD